MHHQHAPGFMVAIFVFFTCGAALNVWRHSASVVNSALNGISSYGQYFKQYGSVQATKTFAAFLFLMIWLFNQSTVAAVLALFWPGGTVPQWAQGILVVTPATAGAFGLFFDVAEDLAIVYLKKIAPQLFPKEVPPTPVSVVVKAEAAKP